MATFGRTQSIEQRIGPSGRVAIRVTSSDTRIHAVEGDHARVRAMYEIGAASEADADAIYQEAQLRVNVGDGFLEIGEPRDLARTLGGALSRIFRGEGRIDLELDVEVPPGCELRFEGVSADVQATGLHGGQRFQTVSGDLLLREAGGALRIDSTSGDVTIRAEGSLALQANTVSGDLSAVAPEFTALRINSVSGDVELEGAFEPAADHRIDTVSGDVAVGLLGGASFDVRGLSTDISSRLPHRIEGGGDQRRVVIGDGAARVRFNSMSGDLSIGAPRRLGEPSPAVPEPHQPRAEAQAAEEATAMSEMETLRALERGEIDVEEATRRLTAGRDR